MQSFRRTLIGDRAFYRSVFVILIPMVVQNAITNFVSLLDNMMVGQLGTEQMSGVAIANTLLFVFQLTLFGAVSGAGIFGAQYAGARDNEGLRNTFRYKIIACVILLAAAAAVFAAFGRPLMMLYLTDTSDPEAVRKTMDFASSYLRLMLLSLPPFALSTIYASTLRETGKTTLAMTASISAVLTNLVGNYVLIFGKFGFPALGVQGAAVSTIISRYLEAGIIIIYVTRSRENYPWTHGAWRSLKIPLRLAKEITLKGMPLMVNEFFWSLGQATLTQLYSVRGLSVIAGFNISSTISNLFSTVYMAMGGVAAVLVGQALGADRIGHAKRTAWQVTFMNVAMSMLIGGVTALIAPLIPLLYNTTDEVRQLASVFIRNTALFMPAFAFAHCAYFILRSGGKTIITFLFDCGFSWGVVIPLAAVLVHLTELDITALFPIVLSMEVIKCVLGFAFVKKGVWIQNVVK